jgi:hypothetical protein
MVCKQGLNGCIHRLLCLFVHLLTIPTAKPKGCRFHLVLSVVATGKRFFIVIFFNLVFGFGIDK